MIRAQVKTDINFPEFNLRGDIKKVADQVIIPDIHGNMQSAKSISGAAYGPLATSTKKQKSRKGQGFLPLKATGQMRKSIRSKFVSEGVVITLIGGRRDGSISNRSLGDILQNKGVRTKSGRRTFEFFGISKRAETEAIKFMERKIRKQIDRGR